MNFPFSEIDDMEHFSKDYDLNSRDADLTDSSSFDLPFFGIDMPVHLEICYLHSPR